MTNRTPRRISRPPLVAGEIRRGTLGDGLRVVTEQDKAIEQKLQSKVLARFKEQPLIEVVQELGRAAGINVYLDPRGLERGPVALDAQPHDHS